MPALLEDLAEEASASNRRLADRLVAEAQVLHQLEREAAQLHEQLQASASDIEELARANAALVVLRQRVVESARLATNFAVARLPQFEGDWRLGLKLLRNQLTSEEAERLLQAFLVLFESSQQLVGSPRSLWSIAKKLGAMPELDELDHAQH